MPRRVTPILNLPPARPAVVCRTREDFHRRMGVFLQDMSMQKIRVSFQRVGYTVVCNETGHRWEVLERG
jgi:hypothetical protein